MHASISLRVHRPYTTVDRENIGRLNILSEQLHLVIIYDTPIFKDKKETRGYDLKLHQFLTVLFCSVSDTVGHQILIKTVKGKAMYNNQIHSHVGSRSAGKQIIVLSALP